jgi:hypothetical protein
MKSGILPWVALLVGLLAAAPLACAGPSVGVVAPPPATPANSEATIAPHDAPVSHDPYSRAALAESGVAPSEADLLAYYAYLAAAAGMLDGVLNVKPAANAAPSPTAPATPQPALPPMERLAADPAAELIRNSLLADAPAADLAQAASGAADPAKRGVVDPVAEAAAATEFQMPVAQLKYQLTPSAGPAYYGGGEPAPNGNALPPAAILGATYSNSGGGSGGGGSSGGGRAASSERINLVTLVMNGIREPVVLALLGFGVLGLGIFSRRGN